MGDFTNNNSGNLANTIKGLKIFDGRKTSESRDWHKQLAVTLGVTCRDIARLSKGQTRSSQQPALSGEARAASDKAIAEFDRANEHLHAILYVLTDKPAALLVAKYENATGTSGSGQQALIELINKYKNVTHTVTRSIMDKLVNTTMKQGENPDGYFMEKTLARAELEKMGELISDRRFQDICVQWFTSEYRDIKMMIYRDPTFDIDQMQSTMRHLYLEYPFHSNGAKGKVAARGEAMTARTTTSNHCGRDGHLIRNCRKKRDEDKKSGGDGNHHDNQPKKNKKLFGKKGRSKVGSKGAAGQKWCSVHNATTHSDDMCYAEGAPRPKRGGANLASAVLSASSPPANDDHAPSLKFDDDFDKGLACSALNTASDGRISRLHCEKFTMLVDSGASDHFVDEDLVPGLRQRIRGLGILEEPKPIETAGNKKVFVTATGTICGHIINPSGKPLPVRIFVYLVPGMGRHLFSSVTAMK